MYHYVYRITNLAVGKHYYGKRSSKNLPVSDIGINYFSSSKDEDFIRDQKVNPQNYEYIVVAICDSAKEAVELEIYLHAYYDVGVNPKFYNRAKQTTTGWDTTGVIYTEELRERLKAARAKLNFKHTEESKEKMRITKYGNSWNKGKKHTEETKEKLKEKVKRGTNSPNAVLVNIFDHKTYELIASNVCLSEWCKDDKSLRANLALSLKGDRSLPFTKYNVHHSKGFYARHTSV